MKEKGPVSSQQRWLHGEHRLAGHTKQQGQRIACVLLRKKTKDKGIELYSLQAGLRMANRVLLRAKNAWRKFWNLYERPSPYEDAPPKSTEGRYPSPASQPPPEISTDFPVKTERLAHAYVFEREQRGTFTEEAPTTEAPNLLPPATGTAVQAASGAPVAVPGSRPFSHLKPLDMNRDPKANLHEYWRKVNEFYGMDMRNMRNWERYPDKIFTEEGKGRVEYFPVIDVLRVSQPPWYGY